MNIFSIEDYKNLLQFYKKNNFEISNFRDFHNKYKNNIDLPSKFILLRHDIHLRDIPNAYKMIELENKYYGKNISTYFVQWYFIGTNLYEENCEKKGVNKYEKFIFYCLKNNIDVQPHYSLFSKSYKSLYERMDNNINFIHNNDISLYVKSTSHKFKSVIIITDSINKQTNYKEIDLEKDNIYIDCELVDIKNEINKLLNNVKNNLINYITQWKNKFSFNPECYSCHGDGIKLTHKLNPNILSSSNELENILVNANSYKTYLGNSSVYKLKYKSDNTVDKDLINKSLYHSNNDQYQLLIHPFIWSNVNIKNISS